MVSKNQFGRPMTNSIAWYLAMDFVFAASGVAYCQQPEQSRAENRVRAEDRATLIVFAPVGPVFVD